MIDSNIISIWIKVKLCDK